MQHKHVTITIILSLLLVAAVPIAFAALTWQQALSYTNGNAIQKGSTDFTIISNLAATCNNAALPQFFVQESITDFDVSVSGNAPNQALEFSNLVSSFTGSETFDLYCVDGGSQISQTVSIEVRDQPNTTLSANTSIVSGQDLHLLATVRGLDTTTIRGVLVTIYDETNTAIGNCTTNIQGQCNYIDSNVQLSLGNYSYFARSEGFQTTAQGVLLFEETDTDGTHTFSVVNATELLETRVNGTNFTFTGFAHPYTLTSFAPSGPVNGSNASLFQDNGTYHGSCLTDAAGMCTVILSFQDVGVFNYYGQSSATGYLPDTDTNSTVRVFVNASSPPWFPSVVLNPDTNVTHFPEANYTFSIEWNDHQGIDTVLMEHNFTGVFINETVSNVSNIYNYTTMNLNPGAYAWQMIGNDTLGFINRTGRTIYTVLPNAGPVFSNIILNPVNASTYSANRTYMFNVTWTDVHGIGTVTFESNFTGVLLNSSVLNNSDEYYFNITDLAPGAYTWKMYANDSFGNENMTTINTTYIVFEGIAPQFSGINFSPASPARATFPTLYNFSVNWSDEDPDGVGAVLIEHNFTGSLVNASVNGTTNGTYVFSIWNLTIGSYQWRMIANDSSGLINRSDYQNYTVIMDDFPFFGGISVNPASAQTYAELRNYSFNVSWNDSSGLTSVVMEHNFEGSLVNVTATNISDVYSVSFPTLPAGNFTWRMIATNTYGNVNFTDYQNYTINQDVGPLNISITPQNATSLDNVTLFCTTTTGQVNSFTVGVTGVGVSANNGLNASFSSTYAIGNYTGSCGSSATQNYSANTVELNFTISSPIAPTILGISGNVSGTTGDNLTIEVNATDDKEVASAILSIGGVNQTMNGSAGINATFTSITTLADNITSVDYVVYVFDNDSLVTTSQNFTITIVDNDAPILSATNLTLNESVLELLSITASDNIALDSFVWVFGDGSNTTTTIASVNHTYTPDGNYTVEVYANDTAGNIANINFTAFVQDNNNTDLAMVGFSGPTLITLGTTATFNATVQNQGADNESSTVVLLVNGTQIVNQSTNVLISGAQESILLNWTPTQEMSSVLVTTEVIPVAGEVDVTNNNASLLSEVRGIHDIAVVSLNITKQTPLLFETVPVFGNITNEGNVNESNVTVELVDISANVSIDTQYIALAAQESSIVTFNWTPQTTQFHTLRLRTSQVTFETDLADNELANQSRVYSALNSLNLSFAHPSLFPNSTETFNESFFFWIRFDNLEVDTLFDLNVSIDTTLPINTTRDGNRLPYKNYTSIGGLVSENHWWSLNASTLGATTITASVGFGADQFNISRTVTVQ